jgi:hypothetical protein
MDEIHQRVMPWLLMLLRNPLTLAWDCDMARV